MTAPEEFTSAQSDAIAAKRIAILERENGFAREFASRTIDRPELTVWMAAFPPLLIPYALRRLSYRSECATVVEYYLAPRLKALEIVTDGTALSDLPASDRLSTAESAQIETLVEHYRTLLAAEGNDYRTLVLESYRTGDAYRRHLDHVEIDQSALDEALLANANADFGARAAKRMRTAVERIMAAQRDMHREEISWLFGTD